MKQVLVSALVGMVTLVGCGVREQGSETASTPAIVKIAEGEFQMFKDPAHQLTGCDVYTNLELKNTKSGPVAIVEERLQGLCEIHVEPNTRVYELRASEAGCGSLKYESREMVHRSLIPVLKVVDHRTRLCEDVRPNIVTMTEFIFGDYVDTYSLGFQR